MTADLRLFWIEARRSVAIWFVPVVLAVTWYIGQRPHATDMTLWSKKSAAVGQALIVLAPLMGALAAWIAGRDRRRGIEDLLATTPKPAVRRDLLGLAASAGWALLAYVAAVAVVFLLAFRAATWGSPDLFPSGWQWRRSPLRRRRAAPPGSIFRAASRHRSWRSHCWRC